MSQICYFMSSFYCIIEKIGNSKYMFLKKISTFHKTKTRAHKKQI